jgi:phenol 2-monooxygenase
MCALAWPEANPALINGQFPDVRLKVAIHSAESGSILIVPREKGLVRCARPPAGPSAIERPIVSTSRWAPSSRASDWYELRSVRGTGSHAAQDRNAISLEKVIATAQRIMAPFTLECPEIAWWTV